MIAVTIVPDEIEDSTALDHYDLHSDLRSETFSCSQLDHTL